MIFKGVNAYTEKRMFDSQNPNENKTNSIDIKY